MQDVLNLQSVKNPNTDMEVIKIDNIPEYDIEDYDLNDEKDYKKYIIDVERECRNSFEYRQFVNYLRDNMNMNCCSFYENVNNVESYKIRIELHHSPFTLYDIAIIVTNKRLRTGEPMDVELVAKEIMLLHYSLLIGIIPLSQTVHELVHNNYLFVPIQNVLGKVDEFVDRYGEYMTPQQHDSLDNIKQLSSEYEQDFQLNTDVLNKKYLYVDISGVYNLPTFNEIIQQMQSRIEYIKSNPTGIKKEQPLKKIWFVTDKDNQ